MPGLFYVTGLIVPSNTGRSFKVYTILDNGEKVFIGLISRKSLSLLLQKQISTCDICKFSTIAAQEPLELGP